MLFHVCCKVATDRQTACACATRDVCTRSFTGDKYRNMEHNNYHRAIEGLTIISHS